MSTFRRPIDATESLRSTRRSLGDGTVAGRSRLAMPPQNKARGTGGLFRVTPAVDGVSLGECIAVQATSVPISTTPTLVEFSTVLGEREGFVFVAPSTQIRPTMLDAYYDIQVEIGRGAYAGTVAVEVLRGNEVVWPLRSPSYWDDPQVPVTAKGRLVDPILSPWQVRITGDGAGTLDYVVATAELVDRPNPNLPLSDSLFIWPDAYTACNDYFAVAASPTNGEVCQPPTTQIGDLVVAFVGLGGDAVSDPSPPAGWTEEHAISGPGNAWGEVRMKVWWRIADTAGSVIWNIAYTHGFIGTFVSRSYRIPASAGFDAANPMHDQAALVQGVTPSTAGVPSVQSMAVPGVPPGTLILFGGLLNGTSAATGLIGTSLDGRLQFDRPSTGNSISEFATGLWRPGSTVTATFQMDTDGWDKAYAAAAVGIRPA